MIVKELKNELLSLKDESYQKFCSSLMPTVNGEKVIGIKTPILKSLAKKYAKSEAIGRFLSDLPHEYFEENNLHAFIISEEKDFEKVIFEVEKFLPFIDNWATCDQLIPKAFKKEPEKLLPYIDKWLLSGEIYAARFAIGLLMRHFLDGRFEEGYLYKAASAPSGEYYVDMMKAWYFATALCKQYDSAVKIIQNDILDKWTHNKAVQKAIESFRVSNEQKSYLKTLKR